MNVPVVNVVKIVKAYDGEESARKVAEELAGQKIIGVLKALAIIDKAIGTKVPVFPSFGKTDSRGYDIHFSFNSSPQKQSAK